MDHLKHLIDAAAVLTILANIFNHMPAALTIISSLSAIFWYWLQIVDFKQRRREELERKENELLP